ncbi:TetR/AcrR family transcriptional regulator [Pelomonas sp. KK5]|uniref:TetR/AcrR family transcriptional regulator n=1 Tax=Pelomonas sp. KK5 TaxID=1855730 RepID=UPI00097BFEBC|nr:TetR/AcrR family transcriptional regulator [Pelomonas sp. KK5]
MPRRKEVPADPLASSLALIDAAHPGPRGAARRAVLAHALRRFNEQGLEGATIEQLRQGSGQSVGAIYHHFGSKEGVVAALFFVGFEDQSRAIAAALAQAGPDTQRLLAALIGAYLGWIETHAELARYVLLAREAVAKGPGAAQLGEALQARYQGLDEQLARAMAGGEIRRIPEDLIPALILGPAESYCRGWLAGRRELPPSRVAQELALAAWKSLV